MAMDLRILGIHPEPERLSPKVLTHMHGLAMASKRRLIAMEANATMMACSAGFNGDKDRHFQRFINRLMARPVFRLLRPEKREEAVNVVDYEEGRKAAEAHMRRILEAERALASDDTGAEE